MTASVTGHARGTAVLRFGAGWLVAVCLCSLLALQSAQAQQTPAELRKQALEKTNRGEFVDAITDFQQLIAMLGESRDSRIMASMEMVYYQLAVCHFFAGEFEAAEKGFDAYRQKYRHGSRIPEAALYTADAQRFRGELDKALASYGLALRKHTYEGSVIAEIHASMARCHLAKDNWQEAIEPLNEVYRRSHDNLNRNWAATLLTTVHLKLLELDKIYPLVPYLLRADSLASRSVAFNLAALEAGDALFAQERYREALWVFRLVYPHDTVELNSEQYLAYLQRAAENMKRSPGNPRRLIRIQESLGELEAEGKTFADTPNYDVELYYRIARGYMAFKRFREARTIFLHLHDVADKELAEEALFLAFQCSTPIEPLARVFALGEQYMQQYPAGEYFDTVTLVMGQLYAKQQDWPNVIRHLKRSLELHPAHASGAECMFLIGYASFMEEAHDEAVAWLSRVPVDYPASERIPDATYWAAMALLFSGKYEGALASFGAILVDFPECPFVEDAAFRTAVCEYGLTRLEAADARLQAFINAYPDGRLLAEALMMRGDIAGAAGRLEEAVGFYQRAMSSDALNAELYNHCAFQAGRILFEDQQYDKVRAHFEAYLAAAREGANLPQAIYWIGVSLWNSGEQDGAMRYYREAVETYGNRRAEVGIDLILDEWVGRAKRASPEQARRAWNDLNEALSRAERQGQQTLALRLKRVKLYEPDLATDARDRIRAELLNPATITNQSPAVLQAMLELAQEQNRTGLVVRAAQALVDAFPETDYALQARMVLARLALDQARRGSNATETKSAHLTAIQHLTIVRDVYATTSEAGEALMLLGEISLAQKRYADADSAYQKVLGVREWKPLWPEALYGRGEAAMAQGKYEAAAACYERIYVMYRHYADWTAKAYLRRAECLRNVHQPEKAREVLTDMLAQPGLPDRPEGQRARDLMRQWGGA